MNDQGDRVEIGERLAAYLAGDLDARQHAEVEERLADDPALRAHLERIRRVDGALGALPPVTPPPGFSRRLRAAVSEELARAPLHGEQQDDLARRRERRLGLWWRRAGIAAAAAAVVGVTAIGVAQLLDDMDEPGDSGGLLQQAAPAEQGAPITVSERDYSASEVRALPGGDAPETFGALSAEEARRLQQRRAGLFVVGEMETTSGGAVADRAAEAPAPEAAAVDDPTADVARCLPSLLEHEDPVIPVQAEVARYEGEPAILYVLVSRNPDSGAYDRVEVWVLARTDCQVLLFTQG